MDHHLRIELSHDGVANRRLPTWRMVDRVPCVGFAPTSLHYKSSILLIKLTGCMVAREGFEPPTSAYGADKLPLLYLAMYWGQGDFHPPFQLIFVFFIIKYI